MGLFSVALSGLNASSEDLSVISNNLANMNTVGYKASTANFQDLFYQQIGTSGNNNPEQIGEGVQVGSVDSQFTQGSIQATGVPTDVAIQGQGFFVVNKNGTQEFTRAGNFSIGANGQLMTTDGGNVMGYVAVNGVVNPSSTVSPITIPSGLVIPPKASTQFSVSMTLDSDSGTGTAAASQQTGAGIAPATVLATGSTLNFNDGTNNFTYTSAAGDTINTLLAAINANANFSASLAGNSLIITAKNGTPITFTANTLTDAATSTQAETFATSGTAVPAGSFSTPVTVYDSLGATHVLTANFTKTAASTWNYTLTIPATDVGQTGAPVTVNSGTLLFNGNGQLVSPASNVALTINNLADGASPLNITWNLLNASGSGLISQVSGPSAATATQTDGYSSGALQTISIAANGTIDGVFSNGQTLAVGQLALASFANAQGLLKNGSNTFLSTLASGQPTIGAPNAGGLGSVTGGSLEQSNVDIATEFANLIIAQRDYQANAQTVTTLDQVSQYAISMIQNG
ncbi:MAG TPA: flagellar hook protein FlgE [Candidatus Acidoferrales bacterium]|nr:flagellar hook protein FlgE [Candidatus Acidoferrales bacterium]